jgi:asparagine synthase (glutamine-hydrolysing)
MCGIAGYIGKRPIDESKIKLTLERMRNRGPDFQDYREHQHGDTFIYLLHSRLSIIDLDARSHQPFTIDGCTIIYNGEIYNYVELRKDLEKRGVAFKTTSDTEVLLQYYLIYGEACVDYFEGMWSFVIYDRTKKTLFLSRDRFAEKPLYYSKADDGFYFGSEIKFIAALSGHSLTANVSHLLRYLVNGYKSLYKTEETFFEEIHELPYASNMLINHRLKVSSNRYWKPGCVIKNDMTLDEAIEGVRHHLMESMRIRLRSDVPLAFCLSGGVDSASLASIAAKQFNYDVATFSIIESDERYNEYDNIMATIRDIGCKHTLIEIPQEESLPRLRNMIAYHDVPIATITYYIHSLLSEAIARNGYRVAFSGTSADELFTGYYDHFILHLSEMYQHPDYSRYLEDWQKHIDHFIRNPILKDPTLYIHSPSFREHVYDNSTEFAGYLNVDFVSQYIEEKFCDSMLRNRMLNELFHESTPVILHEDDLNSMCYSIENRSPYLDSRLFAFAYSIPGDYLIRNGYGKYLLREAMKGILNDQVRLDRRKKGFNASINSMIDLGNQVNRDYLLDERAQIFQFLKREKVEKLFDSNPVPNHYSKFLFSFINARIFLEMV